MNFPLVVDIAIGLIFIYLTLSLIASELQELLATVLQWRAKHLRKSIELLLSGGSEAKRRETEDVQKAKKLVQELYDHPLINTLNYEEVEEDEETNVKRVETRFRKIGRILSRDKVFSNQNSAASYIPSETFASTLLQTLKLPELIQKVQSVQKESDVSLHVILASYNDLKKVIQEPLDRELCQQIQLIYGEIDQDFQRVICKLPENVPGSVINSLSVLAKRSRIKTGAKSIDEELNLFREEVETWFDRSMERATGVYKRNAKGIALLIGLAIAAFTNTDTFHVISRLSKDSAIRSAITQHVSQQQDFNDIKVRKQFYKDLDNSSLPIGWNDDNLSQQYELRDSIKRGTIQEGLIKIFQFFRMILGWIISGIAISMGAPFWFDMLKKVMNVRGTGPKPEAYTKDRSS
jgi:hypothetical protein